MPNTPIALQLPPPTKKGTTSEATMLQTFPDINTTVQGMATMWLLSKQSSDFVSIQDYDTKSYITHNITLNVGEQKIKCCPPLSSGSAWQVQWRPLHWGSSAQADQGLPGRTWSAEHSHQNPKQGPGNPIHIPGSRGGGKQCCYLKLRGCDPLRGWLILAPQKSMVAGKELHALFLIVDCSGKIYRCI